MKNHIIIFYLSFLISPVALIAQTEFNYLNYLDSSWNVQYAQQGENTLVSAKNYPYQVKTYKT